MKISIMQPYLFPYIGYISLIRNTDKFIFFDTPQYIKKGWINRNRIINSKNEVSYFTVPIIKCPRETPINEVKIDNNKEWRKKILGQMTVYKNKAPNYNKVLNLISEVFDTTDEYLSPMCIKSIVEVCKYLDIKLDYEIFSYMKMNITNISAPDEWALEITDKLNYKCYVNPTGGMNFFNRDKYVERGIELEFLKQELIPYVQKIGHFESGLSIIDVLMFCSESEVINMLDNYCIL